MGFVRSKFVVLTVLTAISSCPAAESLPHVELHVAVDGDDSQAGTIDRPLRTIHHARDLVRETLAAGVKTDVTVYLRGGTYYLDSPLVFDHRDSAPDGKAVTYTTYSDEAVTLSGGRRITGWRPVGHLLTTTVPQVQENGWCFRELYVNGERRPRARTPNRGFLRVDRAGPDRRTSFFFQPSDANVWSMIEEAELVFLHDWSISQVGIKSVDHQTREVTLSNPIGCSADHYRIDNFEPHPRYFVENVAALLDEPGEWFLDCKTGTLTYWPKEGESAADIQAVAPRLTELLVVGGDAEGDLPVRGLNFRGITWRHCRWTPPAGGYAEGQASFHERRDGKGSHQRVMIPAAMTFDRAEKCSVENCLIMNVGGCGIHLRAMCRDNRIVGNTVQDIASNGIMLGETFTRQGPPVAGTKTRPELVSKGNLIADNVVRQCGQVYSGAVGIWIGIAAENMIVRNEVRDLPYTGISVGWKWNTDLTGCRGNVIEANHIHDVMQVLSDGGGIYTLGRQPGAVLRRNRIHDVPVNAGRAESNGIFMDQGSTEFVVEQNTIYNIDRSAIRFHQAKANTLRNNRLVVRPGVPAFRYNNAQPETMTFDANQIIEAESWELPADDATAGVGPAPAKANDAPMDGGS